MGTLRLTQASGLALTIPAGSVRMMQAVPLGQFADAPTGQLVLRFVIGAQVRTRVLSDSLAAVRAMLLADKVARQDWIEAEQDSGELCAFLATDVAVVEDLDPEAERSKGCTAMVDLEIAGVPVTDLYLRADPAEIRAAAEPPEAVDQVAKPAKGARRVRQPRAQRN